MPFLMVILFSVLAVFSPVFFSSYILNFDDNSHLVFNALAVGGDWASALNIFFTPDNANKTYIPLTMLTFFGESQLWGFHSWISHGINLALHLAVCGMAVMFGRALGLSRWAVYAGVLIFAIHPMHVEPVAWVTARKDLLYSFFYLSAMTAYLRYIDSRRGRDYITVLVAAALSVLSKPMALSLPLILFVLDWYKGRPFSFKLVLEKIPFFLVVEPVAAVTYVMNARESVVSWPSSLLIWVWCAFFYIQKFFVPLGLVPVYGAKAPVAAHIVEYTLVCSFWVMFGVAAWFLRRHRLFIFSGLFYAVSLFFIWRMDVFDLTFVADRFMYLPSLGICFLLGDAAARCWRAGWRRWLRGLVVVVGLVMMVMAHHQAGAWRNTLSLWTRNMQQHVTPFVAGAYAEALFEEKCFKDNKDDFIRWLSARFNVAPGKFRQVYARSLDSKINAIRTMIALKTYLRVVRMAPDYQDAYTNIGLIYTVFRQYERAILYLDRAIHLATIKTADLYFSRGVAYEYLGRQKEALADYTRCIAIADVNRVMFLDSQPLVGARLNRANIFRYYQAYEAAWTDVVWVLQAFPGDPKGYEFALLLARDRGDDVLAAQIRKLGALRVDRRQLNAW
jgi:hypothetical protein